MNMDQSIKSLSNFCVDGINFSSSSQISSLLMLALPLSELFSVPHLHIGNFIAFNELSFQLLEKNRELFNEGIATGSARAFSLCKAKEVQFMIEIGACAERDR